MVTEREGQWGRNREGNGGRGGSHDRRGQRWPGAKMSPLVEDVPDYWESYEGDRAD